MVAGAVRLLVVLEERRKKKKDKEREREEEKSLYVNFLCVYFLWFHVNFL